MLLCILYCFNNFDRKGPGGGELYILMLLHVPYDVIPHLILLAGATVGGSSRCMVEAACCLLKIL